MLDYDTCLKLKEAGFSQELEKGDWYFYEKRKGVWLLDSDFRAAALLGKTTKLPTLSELIEACGERFIGLDSPRVGDSYKTADLWAATGMRGERDLWTLGEGETPEQAVANLFLAIYKPHA